MPRLNQLLFLSAVAGFAVAEVGSAAQCTMHIANVGYTSQYYAVSKENTSDDCCAVCAADAKCEAWTWHQESMHTKKGTGNCLITDKGHVDPHGDPGTNKTLVSGSKHPIAPTPPTPKPKHPTPGPPGPTPAPIKPNPPGGKQPNIVLFLQDDQDLFLGGWTPMNQSKVSVNAKGGTSTNWWVGSPLRSFAPMEPL